MVETPYYCIPILSNRKISHSKLLKTVNVYGTSRVILVLCLTNIVGVSKERGETSGKVKDETGVC